MITIEMMPPMMFGGLVLAMLIGFPVAFTLAALGLSFGFLAIHEGFFGFSFLQAIPERIYGSVLANELLLAIPFFTFMGSILERCGLAEDMLDSMGQLFGPIRGGLGYSVIIVGFILGAITGTVAAQVIAMALISMPVMIRYGYNMRYITGVLAASGTITQLVPPSLVLIVLADQLGKSVGDMYLGAWGPSILQIALFAGYTFALSVIKPGHVPAVPKEARTLTGWALWRKCLLGIIPSAVLIFVVLGTMMLGLATPTEAGAMGAVGAIVLAVIHHKDFSLAGRKILLVGVAAAGVGTIIGIYFTPNLPFKIAFAIAYLAVAWVCIEAVRIPDLRTLVKQGYETTMRITCMVTFILIGSTCFSIVFLGCNGGVWLEHMLTSLPGRGLGIPDLHEPVHLLHRLLPRLLRDRLHHHPDDRADRAEAAHSRRRGGCCLDLVRCHALRQHADLLPASAVRLRLVLPAGCCAEGGQELGHLLGRYALDRPAGDHGCGRHRIPDHGHGAAGCSEEGGSGQDQDRNSGHRAAAAA
ncbi:tripartite ATP-independent transporter DctM subunit [Bradyrhizobium ottawaense]